jgi:hypothetical protein
MYPLKQLPDFISQPELRIKLLLPRLAAQATHTSPRESDSTEVNQCD